jgi:hypothetical protein
MVSDIVLLSELPQPVLQSAEAYASCIAGALLKDRYIAAIEDAGFRNIEILSERAFETDFFNDNPDIAAVSREAGFTDDELRGMAGDILSISVAAVRPS